MRFSVPPLVASVAAVAAAALLLFAALLIAGDGVQTREVTGLFTEPRETKADVYRSIGPIPPSRFSDWDGSSVVLYNVASGAEIDLGEGSIGFLPFSPDGTKFAWVSGPFQSTTGAPDGGVNTVWVLDLETMERRSYGEGWQVSFYSKARLRITTDAASAASPRYVNLASGSPVSVELPDYDPSHVIVESPYGYRIERFVDDNDDIGNARHLIVPDDGSRALQFEAWIAVPLGANELLVMGAITDTTLNLFLLDIERGDATFIATMFGSSGIFPRFGFAGWADTGGVPTAIAWSEYGCDPLEGRTRIYDLRSGTLTELDRGLPISGIRGDGLSLGSDPHRITTLDPETLEYGPVMPGEVGAVWSRDRRWAANGQSTLTQLEAARCELSGG